MTTFVSSVSSILRRRFSTYNVAPHKRTNLIFGANTDVGKSVVSAGLVRASLQRTTTHYIKPMQCGGSDAAFVQRYAKSTKEQHNLTCHTLFRWETPASPHTAARVEDKPVSDTEVLSKLRETLSDISHSGESTNTYIETAGGVLSPSSASPDNASQFHATDGQWGWKPQADLYQPLLGYAPVVLVGDGRLGGISATISSMESLLIRGYDIAALVLLETEPEHKNLLAMREYAARKVNIRSGNGQALFNLPRQSIVSLPQVPKDPAVPLDEWYELDEVQETLSRLDNYLQQSWEGHVADLKELRKEGRSVVWWPFTQHGNIESDEKVTLIDSASGDDLHTLLDDGKGNLKTSANFDACASWWTQGMGHGDSSMALASAAAAGRYGHVIFPDVVHSPAVLLSQRLVGTRGPGHGWANRVFFTDDGSTGMEVAVKMGMKMYKKRVNVDDDAAIDWVVCAQEGCYHGDTLGVMDIAEPSIFNEGQHPWYESKGLFLATPTLGFTDGVLSITFPDGSEPSEDTITTFDSIREAVDVDARILSRKLFSQYKELIEMQWLVYEHSSGKKIGSLVLEPVLMGAGGMKFVDPLWQRALVETAKSFNVPVIFDEVASGLYRVGVKSCREILRVDPDIACYAKLLTGGLLPLSVTLTSEEVFEAFLGDEKGQALLHGHSYTANPVGCVSSLHALEAYDKIIENDENKGQIPRMLFNEEQTRELSRLPIVQQSFSLGSVLAVTLKQQEGSGGYTASSHSIPIVHHLRKHGIFARPLGNVVYIMTSPLTPKRECDRLIGTLHNTLKTYGEEISIQRKN